jgi:hypothetical protein
MFNPPFCNPYFLSLERRGIIVDIHRLPQSVCPFVGIGSPQKAGVSPPLADEGVGGPNSKDWRESLALCIFCALEFVTVQYMLGYISPLPTRPSGN